MASIPNLSAFRSGRGGPRRRGGRGGRAVPENDDLPALGESDNERKDRIIQQTDSDASSSRMSAVSLGYLNDRFAECFLLAERQTARRYPIINRGTYVRTTAIDRLVTRFLNIEPGKRKQVISLGAGSDTRFWRLCRKQEGSSVNVAYHELDFPSNVDQKRNAIERSKELKSLLEPNDQSPSTYQLHAVDLRDFATDSPPSLPGLDRDLPTLLLSECCLCYLPPDTTSSILRHFATDLRDAMSLVLYEPIRPFDAFGKTMVSNLASRGIHLQTLKRYHSLDAQRQRFKLAGFDDGQGGRDVHQIWRDAEWISNAERERVERLEWLDEVEEWELIGSHYCVAWGWRGEVFGTAWRSIEGGRADVEAKDDAMG